MKRQKCVFFPKISCPWVGGSAPRCHQVIEAHPLHSPLWECLAVPSSILISQHGDLHLWYQCLDCFWLVQSSQLEFPLLISEGLNMVYLQVMINYTVNMGRLLYNTKRQHSYTIEADIFTDHTYIIIHALHHLYKYCVTYFSSWIIMVLKGQWLNFS